MFKEKCTAPHIQSVPAKDCVVSQSRLSCDRMARSELSRGLLPIPYAHRRTRKRPGKPAHASSTSISKPPSHNPSNPTPGSRAPGGMNFKQVPSVVWRTSTGVRKPVRRCIVLFRFEPRQKLNSTHPRIHILVRPGCLTVVLQSSGPMRGSMISLQSLASPWASHPTTVNSDTSTPSRTANPSAATMDATHAVQSADCSSPAGAIAPMPPMYIERNPDVASRTVDGNFASTFGGCDVLPSVARTMVTSNGGPSKLLAPRSRAVTVNKSSSGFVADTDLGLRPNTTASRKANGLASSPEVAPSAESASKTTRVTLGVSPLMSSANPGKLASTSALGHATSAVQPCKRASTSSATSSFGRPPNSLKSNQRAVASVNSSHNAVLTGSALEPTPQINTRGSVLRSSGELAASTLSDAPSSPLLSSAVSPRSMPSAAILSSARLSVCSARKAASRGIRTSGGKRALRARRSSASVGRPSKSASEVMSSLPSSPATRRPTPTCNLSTTEK
mmetsp:Transcript_8500/g.21911  ORF Transcript_8500/g.21911 Transcript_8500/m.21911 type:complete len:504 (+) Transcript_8500:63-1574(+)